MSVAQVTPEMAMPRPVARDDERVEGLFDLVHSRMREERGQAAQEQPFASQARVLPVWQENLELPISRADAQADASRTATSVTPDSSTASSIPREPVRFDAREMQSSSDSVEPHQRTRHSPERVSGDAFAVRQGTLPVIVAGQLVELTALRERRSTLHALPVRRLAMRIDGGGTGALALSARLQGSCLIIEFSGPAAGDDARRDACAVEVQHLARRLGWRFEAVEWELSE